jgi:hypothetical protein
MCTRHVRLVIRYVLRNQSPALSLALFVQAVAFGDCNSVP